MFHRSEKSGSGSNMSKNNALSSPTSVAAIVEVNLDQTNSTLDKLTCASVLYKLIEYREWDKVIQRTQESPIEATTWVVRREAQSSPSTIRWKMLPLHTSVLFQAPVGRRSAGHL